MNIHYQLQEDDLLTFQLFTASQAPDAKKKMYRSWGLTTAFFVILAILTYADHRPLAIYFGVFAVLSAVFLPTLYKWRHKRHYARYVKQHFASRFGVRVDVVFTDAEIHLSDLTGETKLKLSAVERISDTPRHFFVHFTAGSALIIPKLALTDPEAVLERLRRIDVPLGNFKDWQW